MRMHLKYLTEKEVLLAVCPVVRSVRVDGMATPDGFQ